jgi:hypothetical protein
MLRCTSIASLRFVFMVHVRARLDSKVTFHGHDHATELRLAPTYENPGVLE